MDDQPKRHRTTDPLGMGPFSDSHVVICSSSSSKSLSSTLSDTSISTPVERKFHTFSIPISRPTDATCDRFLFSIYMCITLHFLFQTFAVFCMLYVFFWVIPRRLNHPEENIQYNSTCFERQALINRSPSPYIQPPVSGIRIMF
jgi:hypothetical protein